MTNFEVTDSVNYAAACIEAPAWEDMIQFPTLQNLRGIPWAGYTILVPRDYAGARLVVFPAESQLSETVAHDLNLHAKAELNADTTLSGYLACNRRIKAIRLRGVPTKAELERDARKHWDEQVRALGGGLGVYIVGAE